MTDSDTDPDSPAANINTAPESSEGSPEESPGTPSEDPPVSEISEALARLEADTDRLKRALAEADNARKRAERAAEQAQRLGVAVFARDILPLADNLRRALAATRSDHDRRDEKDPPAIDAGVLADGMQAMARELAAVLTRHGIEAIDPGGKRFDPNHHEALSVLADTGLPDETIMEVVQVGYLMDGRLLRPAQVIVARQPPGSPGGEEAPGEGGDLQTGASAPI